MGCRPAHRHPDQSAQPVPVIPTGATDGLIVRCAVEGPPHFAFVCSCRCLFLPLHVLAVVCSCRCLFFAFACSLFVIPQRSGICFCSRHCLFSTLPVLRLCLVLSEGAGGYSPGPFLVPLLPYRAPLYVFASLIAPAIEDAKIIPSKTPANPRVKPLDAKKSS